jgi:hypothetical protein
MEEQQRPMGITILGIVGFAVGSWHLLTAMFALTFTSSMVVMGALSGAPDYLVPAYAGLQNFWVVMLGVAGACLLIAGAVGLWNLQRWAYWLTAAGAGISLLTNLLPAFQGAVNETSTFSGILALAVLVYLMLPGVRHAFFDRPAGMQMGEA